MHDCPCFRAGTRYDVSDGPRRRRGCTDCCFTLLNLAGWAGFLAVLVLALEHADFRNLHLPTPRTHAIWIRLKAGDIGSTKHLWTI